MSGTLFFFRAEMFGLLSLLLPLVCWSQGFGYGFLTCYGIIICTRPNLFKTAPKKSNLLGTLVSCYPQSHSCHIFFLNLYGILFLVKILFDVNILVYMRVLFSRWMTSRLWTCWPLPEWSGLWTNWSPRPKLWSSHLAPGTSPHGLHSAAAIVSNVK